LRVTVNVRTEMMLHAAEKRLGYQLTVIQGSYNAGGVSASAGTHDGGGAVDLAPYDWANKVRAMRSIGFAAWHRPAIPGLWGEHIHCIAIGDIDLSPAAAQQVHDYFNGLDGLAGEAHDNEWRPNPIPIYPVHPFAKPPARPGPAAKSKPVSAGDRVAQTAADRAHALAQSNPKAATVWRRILALLTRNPHPRKKK
ncbi:MAG: hypothetical protein ACRDP1_13295, partial [Nocardioidaceae bacterium]